MNVTSRLRKILIILLLEPDSISVKALAEQIGVSKRTVQRELEYIEHELASYQITFQTKTGKGVWLSGSEADKRELLQELKEEGNYDVSNREERRKRLVLEILKDKGLKKLYYYASQFQVSEATVSSDLEAVEGWLNARKLRIIRKPGSGIEISGTEDNYRKAIREFIEENIDAQVLRDCYEVTEEPEAINEICKTEIGQILKEDVLKRVVTCIGTIENKRMKSLTESSYTGLVLHIAIAITRILKHEFVEPKDELWKQMVGDKEYELAGEIVKKLEQEFDISIPDIETTYICLHIKGAKNQSIEWNGKKTMELERKELMNLINEMINIYDPDNSFRIKQDNEFVQGLLAHLPPTFIRLLYDMKISNPVLEEIRTSYPDIFKRCRKAAVVIEQYLGKPVPEEEIGFLTIHFGAAQVRMEGEKENIRCVQVGIICASGIGISRLMLSKLNKIYKDRIQIKTYGQYDITPYIVSKTDFFVSSISLRQLDADIIHVNPLLNQENLLGISQKIYHYERMPKKNQEETVFTTQLEQINRLAMQIKTIIHYLQVFKVSNQVTFEELVEAISVRMSPHGDRQVMIQEAIEEREKLGSQVFGEFGFALLHTRTKGVVRPSFSVCLTKDLEAFTDPHFKGIHVVLVMLLPLDDNIRVNSEILGYISTLLIEDYAFLELLGTGDKSKIQTVLSEHLRKFFNQYLAKVQQ